MKDLVKGIKVNIIGNIFRFSRFGFFILAALLYGTELFGVYTVAWASAELLNRFGMLGLEHGMLFELAHFRNVGEERKLYQKITSSLKACLAISVLGAVGLAVYTHIYVDGTLIRNSMYLLVPLVPLYNIGVLLIQATMGLKEMKYHAIIRSGIEPFSMLVLLFVFWKTPLRPYGIVLAQGTALLLVFLLSLFVFRRFFSWREIFRTWKRPGRYLAIIRYSFPMYIIEIVDASLFRGDIFLLTAILGTGSPAQMSLIGVYGFAKQITRVITQTKNAIMPIFVPVSSETYLREDSSELWTQVRFAMEKLFLLNIALGLFLVGFGKEIIQIVGKEANLLTSGTFLALLEGQFVYSTFSVLMFFLVTTQRSRLFLIFEIIIFGLTMGLGALLVPRWEDLGAAIAVSLGYTLIMITAIFETFRYHARDFMTAHTLRIFLVGIVTGIMIFALKRIVPVYWNKTLTMVGVTLVSLGFFLALTTTRRQWRSLVRW